MDKFSFMTQEFVREAILNSYPLLPINNIKPFIKQIDAGVTWSGVTSNSSRVSFLFGYLSIGYLDGAVLGRHIQVNNSTIGNTTGYYPTEKFQTTWSPQGDAGSGSTIPQTVPSTMLIFADSIITGSSCTAQFFGFMVSVELPSVPTPPPSPGYSQSILLDGFNLSGTNMLGLQDPDAYVPNLNIFGMDASSFTLNGGASTYTICVFLPKLGGVTLADDYVISTGNAQFTASWDDGGGFWVAELDQLTPVTVNGIITITSTPPPPSAGYTFGVTLDGVALTGANDLGGLAYGYFTNTNIYGYTTSDFTTQAGAGMYRISIFLPVLSGFGFATDYQLTSGNGQFEMSNLYVVGTDYLVAIISNTIPSANDTLTIISGGAG